MVRQIVRPTYLMLQFYQNLPQQTIQSDPNQIFAIRKQIFVVSLLAGHHESAITLPNRFPVQSAMLTRHDICKKIQFCCKVNIPSLTTDPRTLLSSKSPNYQFILPPSLPFPRGAGQDIEKPPFLPPFPPQTRHSLSTLSHRVCLSRSFKRLLFTESFFSS